MKEYISLFYNLFSETEFFIQYKESDKIRKISEIFAIILASFSLSISYYFLSPPYYKGYLGIIFSITILHYLIIKIFNYISIALIDWSIREDNKIGDSKLFLSCSKLYLAIFILTIPLSIISIKLEFTKFSGFVFSIFPIFVIYIFYLVKSISIIYGISSFIALRKVIFQFVFLLFIPFELFIYYLFQFGFLI